MKSIFVVVTLLAAAVAAAPSTKSLESDLQEFVDLIPVEELKAIAQKYLTNDKEFQDVVKYLQSEEWAALVQEVRKNPTVQEFKQYLNSLGIDIDAIVDWIHSIIAGAKPTGAAAQRGLKDFIEEVKQALPTAELVQLLLDKLQNSKDFQEFYAKISSEKSHELVEEVRAIPEVQRLAARLLELGIDLKPVIEFIYQLFGWN